MFSTNAPIAVKAIGPGVRVEEAPSRHHAAVLVVHGMGQQVPFETLSAVAEAMARYAPSATAADEQKRPKISVDFVQLTAGRSPLAQASFTLKDDEHPDHADIDVHVYEAYWAPLTAGKATWLDSISFLLSGALNGVLSRARGLTFRRWMFGDFQSLAIKRGTVLSILAALAGLAVVLLPAAVFVARWSEITASANGSVWAVLRTHGLLSMLSLAVLALYSLLLRYVLIEFVGDVAIYVTAHKVSRFAETRTQIQAEVSTVLRQIYQAQRPFGKGFLYDTVVIAGHSLGSVIAYDALNAAITWDRDEAQNLNVVERTRRLITFGSPLDKTAFLFRTQVSGDRYLREALAALKQPLILNYRQFRPQHTFTWVNIYSRADVVSGPLAYYDSVDDRPGRKPVVNVVDYHAAIPFYAHVQYWKNETLHRQLIEAVTLDWHEQERTGVHATV